MEAAADVQKKGTRKKYPDRSRRYSSDFKLQIVKKFLEESIPISVIRQECGVGTGTIRRWVRSYRREGEAGFCMTYTGNGRSLPAPVKAKIVEIKETNQFFGVKRISQLLKRERP